MGENADEKFINAIMQHPYLFDKRETKFKNISLKDTTWRNIGESFNLSSLREKYFRVKRESEKESRSGSGAVTKEKWHLFELLRFLDEVSKARKTIANTMKEAVLKLQPSMDDTVSFDEADAIYSQIIEVNSPSDIFVDVDDSITVEEVSNSSLPSSSSSKSNSNQHAPLGPKKRKTTEDRVCSAMEKVVTALTESVPPTPTNVVETFCRNLEQEMLEMPNDIREDFKDEVMEILINKRRLICRNKNI
ncbi:hypothetical protein RN001_003347 [Aquatica leii]|uniref:MADF domain-containing protein n=1 Tax=Aquatica leii TaxID=1421715 RepID=A0AAN7PR11_9COLE|nr:hypothetical protein RN001_003347 [Aquatica leii]